MKLKEYFDKERINPLAFALQVDVGITSIYRYMNGGRPNKKTAYRIEKLTKGQVTVEDLLPDS